MFAPLPASCLGLLLGVLEFFVVLPDEVDLIWVRPFILTLPRFLYVLCRYFGLAAHILHIILTWRIFSHYPIPTSICRGWIEFQIVVTSVLLNAMDLILMMRIYAFYRRDRQIGLLLSTIFVVRFILFTSTAIYCSPSLSFDEHCRATVPKLVVFGFLVPEIITQSLILGLTFAKQITSSRDTQFLAPITSLLYRDGILIYGAVIAPLIVTLVQARASLLKDFTFLLFPIFISTLSSSTCRMIVNMQSIAAEIPTVDVVELTDVLESLGDIDCSSS